MHCDRFKCFFNGTTICFSLLLPWLLCSGTTLMTHTPAGCCYVSLEEPEGLPTTWIQKNALLATWINKVFHPARRFGKYFTKMTLSFLLTPMRGIFLSFLPSWLQISPPNMLRLTYTCKVSLLHRSTLKLQQLFTMNMEVSLAVFVSGDFSQVSTSWLFSSLLACPGWILVVISSKIWIFIHVQKKSHYFPDLFVNNQKNPL